MKGIKKIKKGNPGYYWVKRKNDNKWEVAYYDGSYSKTWDLCWQTMGWEVDVRMSEFIEIGERIPTNIELKKIASYGKD